MKCKNCGHPYIENGVFVIQKHWDEKHPTEVCQIKVGESICGCTNPEPKQMLPQIQII